MAALVTVWVECRNESVRKMFEDLFLAHDGFLMKRSRGPTAADVVCMELDEVSPESTFGAIKQLLQISPAVEIFLSAGRTEPQVMLEAFRIGVKEFLPQPISRREFDAALSRLKDRLKGKGEKEIRKRSQVVAFIGAKGGIGTSTLAVNLATSLRHLSPDKQVALVDLNFDDSDVPLFLDLQLSKGFKAAVQDLSRLDATYLQSLICRHHSDLHVLQSGLTGSEGTFDEKMPSGTVEHALSVMQNLYDHIFLDCGHIFNPVIREALDCATKVCVITTLSLPSIRRAKHSLQLMREAGFGPEKTTVVVNRYQSADAELLQYAEELFEQKVDWLVPNDYPMASSSLNRGVPLTVHAPRTALAQWYMAQAATLEDGRAGGDAKATAAQKPSLLSRYWGGLTFAPKARS